MMREGKTLKEGLMELGFPKDVTLMADTGIFEVEAKKAGISNKLGINVDFELSNEEIFQAYEISGADFFVAPDEIISPLDTKDIVRKKVTKIKNNLLQILSFFPSSQVIGVIQGCNSQTIESLFDFYKECGIRYFARGGVIPLYRYDTKLFEQVLQKSREITTGYWLHTFGLPRVFLLTYYLRKLGFDSVDTSLLLYLSARKKYLIGINSRPVRLVDFSKCDCEGCRMLHNLRKNRAVYGKEFFVYLYIHNILEAVRISSDSVSERLETDQREVTTKKTKIKPSGQKTSVDGDWTTGSELMERRLDYR